MIKIRFAFKRTDNIRFFMNVLGVGSAPDQNTEGFMRNDGRTVMGEFFVATEKQGWQMRSKIPHQSKFAVEIKFKVFECPRYPYLSYVHTVIPPQQSLWQAGGIPLSIMY